MSMTGSQAASGCRRPPRLPANTLDAACRPAMPRKEGSPRKRMSWWPRGAFGSVLCAPPSLATPRLGWGDCCMVTSLRHSFLPSPDAGVTEGRQHDKGETAAHSSTHQVPHL